MNCPHHIKIYDSQPRSYRDLPVRLAEFGTVYRWEKSGELNGLTRVRGFTQDDAHLFCTEDQIAAEVLGCLSLVKTVLSTLGMSDYRVRVGLRDPDSSKFTGNPEQWDKAEAACRAAAATLGVPFTEEPGEAAFYGPKIDFVVKDVIGREWQLGTVQVDYVLPVRFDLSYIGADNTKHRPVMIHRAPFGSMERFTGVLIEHFAGHFPTWLAPEQVRVLTISEKSEEFANEALTQLRTAGVRTSLDNTAEKIGAKIRNAQLQKIPYMLVIGEKEAAISSVSVRHAKRGDLGVKPLVEFLDVLTAELKLRRLDSLFPALRGPRNSRIPSQWAISAGLIPSTPLPDEIMNYHQVVEFCAGSGERGLLECAAVVLAWRGHILESAEKALKSLRTNREMLERLRSCPSAALEVFSAYSLAREKGDFKGVPPTYFSALIHFLSGPDEYFMMGSKIATGINTHSGQIVIQEPDGRVSDLNTATNYQRFNAELKSFAQNRGVSPIHMQLHFMND